MTRQGLLPGRVNFNLFDTETCKIEMTKVQGEYNTDVKECKTRRRSKKSEGEDDDDIWILEKDLSSLWDGGDGRRWNRVSKGPSGPLISIPIALPPTVDLAESGKTCRVWPERPRRSSIQSPPHRATASITRHQRSGSAICGLQACHWPGGIDTWRRCTAKMSALVAFCQSCRVV